LVNCTDRTLEDEDDGWKRWVGIEGRKGIGRFKQMIVDWLNSEIEWGEDMPDNATSSGMAKRFFDTQDIHTLSALDMSLAEDAAHTCELWFLEGAASARVSIRRRSAGLAKSDRQCGLL
jgi:hypothetical protein